MTKPLKLFVNFTISHLKMRTLRGGAMLPSMRQTHNICSKWDESTVEEYLDAVNALI